MAKNGSRALHSWSRRVSGRLREVVTALLVLFVLALIARLVYVTARVMPQRTVTMAMYPEGSLNAELTRRYQEILSRNGIHLNLVPLAGAVDGVARLRDPRSGISVALVPGGITTDEEAPELASLGTLFYQPLWVFSTIDPGKHRKPLQHLRISIGPEGSSSRALSLKLLGPSGAIDLDSAVLYAYSPSESAEKLVSGELDVAVLLDGWDSPAVQRLIKDRHVNLQSVSRAEAYTRLFPYLNKLILPAGVVDLAEPWPRTDTVLVGPQCSLIVRKDVHPAIQYALLEAAVEIHSTPGMFRKAGQFPAAETIDLPLSDHAREFYRTGTPFLLRYLPLWLALLIEQPVVWLLPLLVVLFPVIRAIPTLYDWFEKQRVYRLYADLKQLEEEILLTDKPPERQDYISRLDELEARASRLSLPTAFRPLLYGLRHNIEFVRTVAERLRSPDVHGNSSGDTPRQKSESASGT